MIKTLICTICKNSFEGWHNKKHCSYSCWRVQKNEHDLKFIGNKMNGDWEVYIRYRLLKTKGRTKLTLQSIFNLLEKQDYKCALSGIPLTCFAERNKKFPSNISIDRIDNNLGYEENNIQLVCYIVNTMKWMLTKEELIYYCKAIVDTNK